MPNHSRPSDAAALRRRMNATGVGYAGIDGAWWLPATGPFVLPPAVAEELRRFGAAVFALFDALTALYETDSQVRRLLLHAIPPHIPQLSGGVPVLMARPDFQLIPEGNSYRLVATEIEVCPAAQGFAHAMQIGYGLETDLADVTARFLDGRPLLIAGSAAWSEFLFEQLAFCRALAERGATGIVLYDRPMSAIAAEAWDGRRWVPPMFGVPARPDRWDTDIPGRIRAVGLDEYLWPGEWPETVGEAVVFRFGYFDCFDPEVIASFVRWRAAGATFLNPPVTWLENKSVLAAAQLPAVLDQVAAIDSELPDILLRCLPETRLLEAGTIPELLDAREEWIIKFAGYDGDNQAWGGRSLQFGRDHSAASWEAALREAARLSWPVVAQRLAPSARIDIDYYDADGRVHTLFGGTTRLRSFLMRGDGRAHALGTHATVSSGDRVAEAIDAVQAPVQFERR